MSAFVVPFVLRGGKMEFDYKSARWRRKRAAILRRDGYLCQMCKRYGRRVQATTVHHIQHADEHPELGFTDSNLISVCERCHNKLHPEKIKKAKWGY
jgi:prophage pi2 protein 28|nr:MAG TPA: NinG recombination protein [Caudoviricetes sp.]